jgi:hypothetical protein
MSSRKRAQGADRAAMVGLLAVGVIFSLIVGSGWSRLFMNTGVFISLVLGVLFALVALGLSYYVASAREESGRITLAAVLPFLLLFCLSALGTLNTLFMTFQGTQVMRSELTAAYEHVIKLREVIKTKLDSSGVQQFRSDAEEKWARLKEEIENPTRCGQGPVAAVRLAELQRVLPNFQLLAGLGCTNATASLPRYEARVKELIERAPAVQQGKPLAEMVLRADGIVASINSAQSELSAPFALNEVKAHVADANTKFAVLRQEAEAVMPGAFTGVPKALDTFQTTALGNVGQVIPFMLARLSDPATYVFFFAALVLDLAMVAAFARVIRREPSRTRFTAGAAPEML